MLTVTVDTNVLPVDDLIASVAPGQFEFAVTSVTDREVEASLGLAAHPGTTRVRETLVWGESRWGDGRWGGQADADCLESTLAVIGDGSFPPPNKRATLTDGQRRQLLDAMIFCAHVREKRAIFVTNDARGFVRNDRRAKLEQLFGTRIMTREEFLSQFSVK